MLVHLDPEDASREYVATAADIPPTVRIAHLTPSDLPRSWRDHPPPRELADRGMHWVQRGETAVLAVPSAVIPQELNYLLDPRHPAFKRIRVGRPPALQLRPARMEGIRRRRGIRG